MPDSGLVTTTNRGHDMRTIAICACLAGVLALAIPSAHAGVPVSSEQGRSFVMSFGKKIVAAYKASKSSDQKRRALVGKAMLEEMDFARLSKAVLAESVDYASSVDRQRFARLFTAFFIDQLLDELGTMDVTGFSIDDVDQVGNGDVIVETEVVMADGDTFAAGWRVSASGGDPRIIDVYISGFSVAGHFGGVFERKSRGDIEWLNDFLGKKVSGSRTLALIP